MKSPAMMRKESDVTDNFENENIPLSRDSFVIKNELTNKSSKPKNNKALPITRSLGS